MNPKVFPGVRPATNLLSLILALTASVCALRADQVEMLNGDRYVGRVLSLGNDTLVLQSEVLGTLRLPRGRITTIALEQRAAAASNKALPALSAMAKSNDPVKLASSGTSSNSMPELSDALRQLNSNSNSIEQVRGQILASAGPEAQAKFNDLLGGLMSGRLNVDDLRGEAKSTLERARAARKELGEDGGSALDSYLAILESFLKETEPAVPSTNSPPRIAKPKTAAPADE